MSVEFLDPRAELGAPPEPYDLWLSESIERPVLGFLANNFVDSVDFALCLEAALRQLVPGVVGCQAAKPDPSDPVSVTLLERLVSDCDAVIGLYGH